MLLFVVVSFLAEKSTALVISNTIVAGDEREQERNSCGKTHLTRYYLRPPDPMDGIPHIREPAGTV